MHITGYTRNYASYVLRNWSNEKKLIKVRRRRLRVYDERVFVALRKVWIVCDSICGKRLAPYLKEIVPVLIRHGELVVDDETRDKLLGISAATIGRLLAPQKAKYRLKARTRPSGSLLNRIPVKTFSEWDRRSPGDLQVNAPFCLGQKVRNGKQVRPTCGLCFLRSFTPPGHTCSAGTKGAITPSDP